MKTCVIFGAGASLAQAERFRPRRGGSTRHPPLDRTFFAKIRSLGISLTPALRAYYRDLVGKEATLDDLAEVRMEEFFKDLFFDFRDHGGTREGRAYSDLCEIYNEALGRTTNWLCDDGHRQGPIGQLLSWAERRSEALNVLTFNHDLLIENEIYKRARLRRRWCLDESYGSISDALHRLGSTVFQEFPAHSDSCDHDRPITVLKLHGSLNWYVRINGRRPSAGDLDGTGPPKDIFLNPTRTIERAVLRRGGGGRGRHVWYVWAVVVPPVYAKQALISRIQAVWADARTALEGADRLVFYGYSMPQVDIEAEKHFQRALTRNRDLAWIDLINPDPSAASRYASVVPNRPLRWYPTLEAFFAAEGGITP